MTAIIKDFYYDAIFPLAREINWKDVLAFLKKLSLCILGILLLAVATAFFYYITGDLGFAAEAATTVTQQVTEADLYSSLDQLNESIRLYNSGATINSSSLSST